MGRQYRPPRIGGSPGTHGGGALQFTSPAAVTSSSVAVVIPNYGITDISTWPAGEFVLDAPVAGVNKTIVSHTSAPAGTRTIRLSPSTANTVTVAYPSPTTGASGNTQINIAGSTLDTCLTLLGLNSTHWLVQSVHPALNSTGTSILST